MTIEPVTWRNESVVLLDQTRLPRETIYREYRDPEEVARAIEKMIVRGAPAIGVTAALGLALAAKNGGDEITEARRTFEKWCERFSQTRPTAVNLFWAIERMRTASSGKFKNAQEWSGQLLREAIQIREEDIAACRAMGDLGAELIPSASKVLTHCNAGALATAGWGTALGVLRSAVAKGKRIHVWVDETRPFLQGARLTAWELAQENIPATLITDSMAGHFMSLREVDLVIVGADRIAANGDVANKIGTYTLSVLAKAHGIPFYVAAPLSTLDLTRRNGSEIPIEERSPEEVLSFAGVLTAPEAFPARHPAFDVTPARNVDAIITEAGIARPPYEESLRKLGKKSP